MYSQEKVKVLVVDDDKAIRDFLTRLLNFEGLEVKSADDGYKALEMAEKEKFDLTFMDIRMPRMSGLETFSRLKKISPDLNCIFMTGYALEESLLDQTKQPGIICLRKPFEDITQIKKITNKILQEVKPATKLPDGTPDRRAYARLDVALEVDYQIHPAGEPLTPSASRDIAPGGIRLFVSEEIKPGAILDLKMRAEGDNHDCLATGKVVWKRQAQDKPGFYEIGIQFTRIDYAELAAMLIRSGTITGPLIR